MAPGLIGGFPVPAMTAIVACPRQRRGAASSSKVVSPQVDLFILVSSLGALPSVARRNRGCRCREPEPVRWPLLQPDPLVPGIDEAPVQHLVLGQLAHGRGNGGAGSFYGGDVIAIPTGTAAGAAA